MFQQLWLILATAPAALAAGIVGAFVLWIADRHKDEGGKTVTERLVAAAFLSIATYTLFVLVTGNFVVRIPISTLVHQGVGDERLAWIFVGFFFDVAARLIRLFDKVTADPPSGDASVGLDG